MGRHDHETRVLPLPECLDDLGHQAQHPARPLEAVERGPVAVEAIEQLGVDRVGVAQAPLVVPLPATLRELLLVFAVVGRERANDGISKRSLRCLDRLEQAPANDLEALFRAGRRPGGSGAPEGVLEPSERLSAAFSADFDVGLRERRHQQGFVRGPGRLGQRLSEGEVGVEAPSGEALNAVQQPDVRHPLVNEDETGGRHRQDLAQRIGPRADAALVSLGDDGVALLPCELPREVAPHRVDSGPVGHLPDIGHRRCGADEDSPIRFRRLRHAGFLQDRLDARQVDDGRA